MSVELLRGWTKDGLQLFGISWNPPKRKICVVMTHGMSGNIMENNFGSELGEALSRNGIGFIYGHNRGYNIINDIRTKRTGKTGANITRRYGSAYEKFNESMNDVQLWVGEAKRLGYKKIILLGHSLGCNKIIHYLSKGSDKKVIGVILASPPDMVALVKLKRYQPNYNEMLTEARKYVKNGSPAKLLGSLIWGSNYISAGTFLDIFTDHCPADNLPLLRNPAKFDELSRINLPILALVGEYDDIAIRSLTRDIDLIQKKATSCPRFEKRIIRGADYVYGNRGKELATAVTKWIKKSFDLPA